MSTLPIVHTQADLDGEVAFLREQGYPYIGSVEHHRLILQADGRIASQWTEMDESGWEPITEDSMMTMEEFWESVFCWRHDC